MADGSHSRMYTRTTRGKVSGFSPKALSDPRPSFAAPRHGADSSAVDSLDDRHRPEHAVARAVFDRYHEQMGVSPFALRALFRRTELSHVQKLEKHIAKAQLARIGCIGEGKTKEMSRHIDFENLSGVDAYALKVALAVKPLDTLYELLDQNQNDPDVRELRAFVAEDRFDAEDAWPSDQRLRAILELYQQLADAEVNLLCGRASGTLHAQVAGIAKLAGEFFNRVRELIDENRSGARSDDKVAPVSAAARTELAADKAAPRKITEETMKQYRRQKRGW